MAIENDIKINVNLSSLPAKVKGFGNLLYLSREQFVSGNEGDLKIYNSYDDVINDAEVTLRMKNVAKYYFNSFNAIPPALHIGTYGDNKGLDDIIKDVTDKKIDYFIVMLQDGLIQAKQQNDYIDIIDKLPKGKMYFFQDGEDTKALDNGTFENTVFKTINDKNNSYVCTFYGEKNYLACAIAGFLASKDLTAVSSSYSAKYLQPNGIKKSEINFTQENALKKNHVNYFISDVLNLSPVFKNGNMSTGNSIEIIQFVEYIREAIKIALYNMLVGNSKISYDSNGLNTVKGVISVVLDSAKNSGFLTLGKTIINSVEKNIQDYLIIMPDPLKVNAGDRADGVLKGVKVVLIFANAIKEVVLTIDIKR